MLENEQMWNVMRVHARFRLNMENLKLNFFLSNHCSVCVDDCIDAFKNAT